MRQRVFGRGGIGMASLVGATVVVLVAVGGGAAASRTNVSCAAGGAGLVAAVGAANAAGGGTIKLASGCTYSLTSADNMTDGGNGLPVIVSGITINGNGTTIAGNSSHFRIIEVLGAEGGALTMNGITLTGGKVMGPGGGLFNNEGTVTLNRVLVTGNFSGMGGGGSRPAPVTPARSALRP